MSLDFIHKFQLKIYSVLSNSDESKKYFNKIYLSVNQDCKPPFLLINITKVNDLSKFDNFIYAIEFEINIFTQEKTQGELIAIADKISKLLQNTVSSFDDYIIAGLKSDEIAFSQAKNLVMAKMTLQYKALIKKRI